MKEIDLGLTEDEMRNRKVRRRLPTRLDSYKKQGDELTRQLWSIPKLYSDGHWLDEEELGRLNHTGLLLHQREVEAKTTVRSILEPLMHSSIDVDDFPTVHAQIAQMLNDSSISFNHARQILDNLGAAYGRYINGLEDLIMVATPRPISMSFFSQFRAETENTRFRPKKFKKLAAAYDDELIKEFYIAYEQGEEYWTEENTTKLAILLDAIRITYGLKPSHMDEVLDTTQDAIYTAELAKYGLQEANRKRFSFRRDVKDD